MMCVIESEDGISLVLKGEDADGDSVRHRLFHGDVRRLRDLLSRWLYGRYTRRGLIPTAPTPDQPPLLDEFVVRAQVERYPGPPGPHRPSEVRITGGDVRVARLIADTLQKYLVDGSGMDNYYLVDGDQE